MRWLLGIALCAGCYRPAADPACSIRCVEGAPDNCPSGFDCIAGFCSSASGPCNGDAMLADMNPIDTSISTDDAGFCVGSNMPLQVCLTAMPTNDVTIAVRTVIDTTTCPNLLDHNGEALCVYTYRTLDVVNTLRFIGPRPAVIVVAGNIGIQSGGVITVAPESVQPGAGSNPSSCSLLTAGANTIGTTAGAGGGAGGGFGTLGGNGGQGGDGAGALQGSQAISPPYTKLRGGCSGSSGGNDSSGGGAGAAGIGGGALAILSTQTIAVNGTIIAYGGAGDGASAAHAAGGGGGAGGMILLDAMTISGNGRVNANGGGGGGGGDDVLGGERGSTVDLVQSPDRGGGGGIAGNGGGPGGNGGAEVAATAGTPAMFGGGGGGGGGGIVLVRGNVLPSLTSIYPRR